MSIDKNHINLLVTIDRNYIGPLSVMLKSYIETNRGVTTDLYIAHSSLGEEEFDRIGEIAKSGDIRVHDMKITERWFSEIPVLERLPEESFYRLLAFDAAAGNRSWRCFTFYIGMPVILFLFWQGAFENRFGA